LHTPYPKRCMIAVISFSNPQAAYPTPKLAA
jgi:hypothetical protein